MRLLPQPHLFHLPHRGLGIELELITRAPQPEQSGCFTKLQELHALLDRVTQSIASRKRATACTGDEQMDRSVRGSPT